MFSSVPQTQRQRKTQFRTVVPMAMTNKKAVQRPQIQTCHVCGGLPLLEVTGADGLLYLVDCPACNGTGRINRREWHPANWLPRWAFSLMAFVGAI